MAKAVPGAVRWQSETKVVDSEVIRLQRGWPSEAIV